MQETRKVQEVNTAYVVNLPKYMAKALEIEKGTKVNVELKGNKIIIEKESKHD